MNWAKIGLFAGGALFGSAGIEILTSKDAKKLYTQCTAAVLRMKDQVMKTATSLQENCGDILADAKEINEQRNADDDAVIEDAADEKAEKAMTTRPQVGCSRYTSALICRLLQRLFPLAEKPFYCWEHNYNEMEHSA